MTALGKALFSVLLVGAGFGLASLFGPPDLADQLAEQLTPGQPADPWAGGDLRPATPLEAPGPAYFARSEVDRLGLGMTSLRPVDEPPRFDPTPRATEAWPSPAGGLASPTEQLDALPQLGIAAQESGSSSGVAPVAYDEWPASPWNNSSGTTAEHSTGLTPVRDSAVRPAGGDTWSAAAPWSATSQPQSQPERAPDLVAPPSDRWPPAANWPAAAQPNTQSGSPPWNQPPATTSGPHTVARPAPPIGAWREAVQSSQAPAVAPAAAPAWPQATQSNKPAATPIAMLAPPARAEAPVPDSPQSERTHLVTDGDTLERLATRYLGDASRAAELFAWNRGVLSHPDLLPIGVELTVSGPANGQAVGAVGLTPVNAPTAATPVTGAPRARLMGPQPAGFASMNRQP